MLAYRVGNQEVAQLNAEEILMVLNQESDSHIRSMKPERKIRKNFLNGRWLGHQTKRVRIGEETRMNDSSLTRFGAESELRRGIDLKWTFEGARIE